MWTENNQGSGAFFKISNFTSMEVEEKSADLGAFFKICNFAFHALHWLKKFLESRYIRDEKKTTSLSEPPKEHIHRLSQRTTRASSHPKEQAPESSIFRESSTKEAPRCQARRFPHQFENKRAILSSSG